MKRNVVAHVRQYLYCRVTKKKIGQPMTDGVFTENFTDVHVFFQDSVKSIGKIEFIVVFL